MVRKLRWRVDQELVVRNKDPLFKENYYSYEKDEFLLDADLEFVKIRNLLDKNPRALREDPLLSIEYLKIINLIKKKKLLEETTDPYGFQGAVESNWHDLEKIHAAEQVRKDETHL